MSALSLAMAYWLNGSRVPPRVAQALKAAGHDPQALEAIHRTQPAD